MPCSDVTENLALRLDPSDRLEMYVFSKKTCGGEIGNYCKLLPVVKCMTCEEILGLTPERLHRDYPPRSELEEFINLKHLFGLQAVVGAILGEKPAGVGETCTLVGVEYDQEGMTAEAEIAVDLLTDHIRACTGCATCQLREEKQAAARPS
ncbi:hypothetical protein HS125_01445 [bacterium]|nr:hypothetical protein [bacterium]